MKLSSKEKCALALKITNAVLLSLVVEGGGRYPEGPFLQNDKNIELAVKVTSAVYEADTGASLCIILERIFKTILPPRKAYEAERAAIRAIGDIP